MSLHSVECKTLIQRLKKLDLDEVTQNPSLMMKFYPIRDPDKEATIFDEVYAVVNEGLMSKTYKFRVFYFLNTFLSSAKVPAYVIAAYIKRLSRLTLDAKPRSLVTILRLVGNLLIRHPVLLIIRDRVDEIARDMEQESNECTLRQWLNNDPFDAKETRDLRNTRAMESCLWELMPLRFHTHPRVAAAASFLNQKNLPEIEFDLDNMLK